MITKGFIEEIEGRIKYLETIISKKESAIVKAPSGTLKCSKVRNNVQYYHRKEKSDRVGKYIPYRRIELAKALAQKAYDKEVLETACRECDILKTLLDYYSRMIVEQIYENLPEARRKLIIPIRRTDEEYIKAWESLEYERKGFSDDAPEFITEKNERVRSKSELIIANTLKRKEVPYRYESPLRLKGIGVVHPDFTILNIRKRETFYWEHLGMMDDPVYSENAMKKIRYYIKNGIYPGESLIITHETRLQPLGTSEIEEMIVHYLTLDQRKSSTTPIFY